MSAEDFSFHPKLLTTLRGYSMEQAVTDATAGLIVGLVALPLAIAFAIASGVSPDRGITTAIIAGFLISCLGGSRVQIGGPTGAFVVIVYKIVEQHGVDGLILASILAGLILIGMGLLRLGTAIKFIPYPLTVGFTSGIAVVIFSSQVKDFLGLRTGTLPADFVDKWIAIYRALPTINLWAAALALGSMIIIGIWPRVSRRFPGPIAAVILGTIIVYFCGLPVETIGSRFGRIPTGLPFPRFPNMSLDSARALAGPAITIALLGAIESLLSATVSDGMIGGRHRSNTELIAQGIANVVAPAFGGIPATGAIARTATNVKNGGRTPIAGMVHSFTLLLVILIFGKLAVNIPLCVLAAILVVVSYHMSEWHAFRALMRAPKSDIAVLLTTFLLTVFVDLTVAVILGILLSLLLFVRRMTDVTEVRELHHEKEEKGRGGPLGNNIVPPGVVVYAAEGAFFFGVAESLRDTFNLGNKPPKVIILRIRHVLALDASGIRAIRDLLWKCRHYGTTLILSGVRAQPFEAMRKAGLLDELGTDNILEGKLEDALARSSALVGAPSRN